MRHCSDGQGLSLPNNDGCTQVAALEEQRAAQQARADALQQERDRLQSELAASRSALGQLECASDDSLAGELQQAQQDRVCLSAPLCAVSKSPAALPSLYPAISIMHSSLRDTLLHSSLS